MVKEEKELIFKSKPARDDAEASGDFKRGSGWNNDDKG